MKKIVEASDNKGARYKLELLINEGVRDIAWPEEYKGEDFDLLDLVDIIIDSGNNEAIDQFNQLLDNIHEENDGSSDEIKQFKTGVINEAWDHLLEEVVENELWGKYPTISEWLKIVISCSHNRHR